MTTGVMLDFCLPAIFINTYSRGMACSVLAVCVLVCRQYSVPRCAGSTVYPSVPAVQCTPVCPGEHLTRWLPPLSPHLLGPTYYILHATYYTTPEACKPSTPPNTIHQWPLSGPGCCVCAWTQSIYLLN